MILPEIDVNNVFSNIPTPLQNTIGEMNDEEILKEARKDNSEIVQQFIELHMEFRNFREKYPEYYL